MQNFVQKRGVKHVVHFTQAENLPSILELGLLGRTDIDTQQMNVAFNDQYRFDYLPNAICCSISFPNYKMFYRLRQESAQVDWVVLRIRPDILWLKSCAFCADNAASSAVSHLPVQERMGLPALEHMFWENDGITTRAELGIPDSYPTNPQAEVLVLDPIEPNWIMDIVVDDKHRIRNTVTLKQIVHECGEQKSFYHGKRYFDARRDYAHW